jgi:hypothetical protein
LFGLGIRGAHASFTKPLGNHCPKEPKSRKEEPKSDNGIAGLGRREKLVEKRQKQISEKQGDKEGV